jgi:hypothetical protein
MAAAVKVYRGTTPNVAIIHLQRLANPSVAYNATTNPYRTIDSLPIDLIAFNGWEDDSHDLASGLSTATTIMFASHQRGETTTSIAANNLWAEQLAAKPLTATYSETELTTPVSTAHVFPYLLYHSLGFMNQSLTIPTTTPVPATYARRTTTPNLGDPDFSGSPSTSPFPWLNCNNRPFVDPLELLLVPAVKTSMLCRTFGISTSDPYGTWGAPYPHLLSLLQSSDPAATSNKAPQMYRLLEMVGVPSRFVGTETQINPTVSATNCNFHPPFNRIPTYREPGKINLNTIYDSTVFSGLMNGRTTPIWTEFLQSRRGDTATDVLAMPSTTCPTEFAHPFRSFGGANLIPSLTTDDLKPKNTREINATLLREGATAGTPLFNYSSSYAYDDTTRNPYFRYQALQRLANLTTTRSNVYAVWITVGYFEVSPAATGYDTTIYPDGYQLGRELGIDTGTVKRHRAFYMYDRSRPVGFQRGQDLNVNQGTLVERVIE